MALFLCMYWLCVIDRYILHILFSLLISFSRVQPKRSYITGSQWRMINVIIKFHKSTPPEKKHTTKNNTSQKNNNKKKNTKRKTTIEPKTFSFNKCQPLKWFITANKQIKCYPVAHNRRASCFQELVLWHLFTFQFITCKAILLKILVEHTKYW